MYLIRRVQQTAVQGLALGRQVSASSWADPAGGLAGRGAGERDPRPGGGERLGGEGGDMLSSYTLVEAITLGHPGPRRCWGIYGGPVGANGRVKPPADLRGPGVHKITAPTVLQERPWPESPTGSCQRLPGPEALTKGSLSWWAQGPGVGGTAVRPGTMAH